MSWKVPRVGHFSEKETREDGITITAGKHDIQAGTSAYDVGTALNYGQGTGSAQLLRWCVEVGKRTLFIAIGLGFESVARRAKPVLTRL